LAFNTPNFKMTAHLCMHPRSKNPGYTYD